MANLIVVERAKRAYRLTFFEYLRFGLPRCASVSSCAHSLIVCATSLHSTLLVCFLGTGLMRAVMS